MKLILVIILSALCCSCSTFDSNARNYAQRSKIEKAIIDFKRMDNQKAFAIAVDDKGNWAYGYGQGHATRGGAENVALQYCERWRTNNNNYTVDKECTIHMTGNVVSQSSGTTSQDIISTRSNPGPDPMEQ